MKFTLQTWHAILLGPIVLAMQYLSVPGTAAPNRAVAIGILFYLTLPALVLLAVDIIKFRRYLTRKKAKS